MIQVNELRIGNWVKRKDEFIKVEGIVPTGINPDATEDEIEGGCFVYAKRQSQYLEPIPLTEDILKQCGFVDISDRKGEIDPYTKNTINEDWIRYAYNLSHTEEGAYICDIELELEADGWWVDHIPCNNIKYLHELQNLFFVLKSEELSFSLITAQEDDECDASKAK